MNASQASNLFYPLSTEPVCRFILSLGRIFQLFVLTIGLMFIISWKMQESSRGLYYAMRIQSLFPEMFTQTTWTYWFWGLCWPPLWWLALGPYSSQWRCFWRFRRAIGSRSFGYQVADRLVCTRTRRLNTKACRVLRFWIQIDQLCRRPAHWFIHDSFVRTDRRELVCESCPHFCSSPWDSLFTREYRAFSWHHSLCSDWALPSAPCHPSDLPFSAACRARRRIRPASHLHGTNLSLLSSSVQLISSIESIPIIAKQFTHLWSPRNFWEYGPVFVFGKIVIIILGLGIPYDFSKAQCITI